MSYFYFYVCIDMSKRKKCRFCLFLFLDYQMNYELYKYK